MRSRTSWDASLRVSFLGSTRRSSTLCFLRQEGTKRKFVLVATCACVLVACSPATTSSELAAEAPIVAGDDVAFCDEIQRRVTAADCAYFTELADRAEAGAAAFNAPGEMTRGQSLTISLAIGYPPPVAPPADAEAPADDVAAETTPPAPGASAQPAPDPTADDRSADDGPGAEPPASAPPLTPAEAVENLPGETVEYTPLIGRFMRAELTHDGGFEVTQVSPASQEVIPGDITIWTWRVRARDDGLRRLELKTVVEGCADEARTTCHSLVTTRKIYDVQITVGWLGRLQACSPRCRTGSSCSPA
jgi:hypothetical protein